MARTKKAASKITEFAPAPDLAGNQPIEKKQPAPEVLVPAQVDEARNKEIEAIERERRRYVRRLGGLRRGLSQEDAEKAKQLCKDLEATMETEQEKSYLPITVDRPWLPVFIKDFQNAPHEENQRRFQQSMAAK